MNDSENIGLDFEIDELTNSVRNVITNDSFETSVSRVTKADLKTITKRKVCYLTGDKNSVFQKEMFLN